MIIHGNYVGNISPQADWGQTDQTKPDFIKGKEIVDVALNGKQEKHKTDSVQLAASGWANNKQTVSLNGMTENTTIIVASAPENYEDYSKAGVYCSAQAVDSLTFTCRSVPTTTLKANVMILT